jgi:energy-coupling factor transporter ATP-binding protein EcfA2
MKLAKRFGVTLFLLLGNLFTGTTAAGQSTYTAQLTGVVTDSSGDVIPGAKVTLVDELNECSVNT